ncbi:alpha-1,2-fucosyltransferase [Flavisolibacter nicotianae]|uniref:alpha-1,2-fucosyltransferase n=1 Tax=Flavisolibacter nicotianae TaxID=2364882 RepID=UPI000EAE26AC|nr:alpha-1,2-fucosyltransferase [Flavisolibacter nicotianae]
MKHRVYADLPKIGLGNLLLIWARAKVFSELNGVPLVTSSWWGIRLGAWKRNEKQKRIYWGYFQESPLQKRMTMLFRKRLHRVVNEPPVAKCTLPFKPTIFRFAEPISQNELFNGIKPYRELIKAEIHKLLQPRLARQMASLERPEIAVHIRRGDFKLGSTITPNEFFIRCIQYIRSETGRDLRVTIYTDAEREEIEDVLQLGNAHLARQKADILDILEMSRCRIMILSQTSTFSYWAAFLSNAIVIKPHGDWYGDIRPWEINDRHYEGTVSFESPETLTELTKSLHREICKQANSKS